MKESILSPFTKILYNLVDMQKVGATGGTTRHKYKVPTMAIDTELKDRLRGALRSLSIFDIPSQLIVLIKRLLDELEFHSVFHSSSCYSFKPYEIEIYNEYTSLTICLHSAMVSHNSEWTVGKCGAEEKVNEVPENE